MSYNYALSKILPTFATFTNEFSPFFPLLYPPFYTSAYSSFRQTLLLSIQNSFSSISLLLPPSSPPVKISNFHPPSLSCIPPEGRLSSFPISSPLSLSAPSLVPPHLPDSFYRSSANSHGGGGVTRPLRRTLPRHLSTLSARMEGNFARYLPTPTPVCQIQPRRSGASVSPPISRGADQSRSGSPSHSASHRGGETATWPLSPRWKPLSDQIPSD